MSEADFKRLYLQEFHGPLRATFKGMRGCAELQKIGNGRCFVRFIADRGQRDGLREARLAAGNSENDAWRIAAEDGLNLIEKEGR